MYSHVPDKREVLIKRGSEKIPKFNRRGGQNLSIGFKWLYKNGKNESRLS